MVDDKVIRESYRSMSTEGLIHFASTEATGLTPAALKILQHELVARNLDITSIESKKKSPSISIAITDPANGIVHKEVVKFALQLKQEGLTDENIVVNLMEEGIEEAAARKITEGIPVAAKAGMAKASRGLLFATFILLAGIALKLIHPYRPFIDITDIIAAVAIGFGCIQLIACIYNRYKYSTVLKNIV
ncbi:MAG: hypothetical protein ABIO05_08065 [Ferruginibacter sp.]